MYFIILNIVKTFSLEIRRMQPLLSAYSPSLAGVQENSKTKAMMRSLTLCTCFGKTYIPL